MGERQYQAGDVVKRFQGGRHGRKDVGVAFTVHKVTSDGLMDEDGYEHDPENIQLVVAVEQISPPKPVIINNYSIY